MVRRVGRVALSGCVATGGALPSSMDTAETMLNAAEAFVALVSEVPHDAWDLPALGVWDVRSLVGHTARAVTTVLDYLPKPCDTIELDSAADYLAAGYRADPSIHQAVAARGVEAGHELGDEPAEVIETMIERVRVALAATEGNPGISSRFGGIRLHDYLQTRTVELVVHTSDISLAVGRESHLPEDAVRTTLLTICAAAMLTGRGLGAVRQLSARDGSGFVLV